MSSLNDKSVRLAVIPNISMDLREPRQVHRLKRAQEQKKVEPAIPWDEIDTGFDPPDVYDDFGDPNREYADAVGISRTKEL